MIQFISILGIPFAICVLFSPPISCMLEANAGLLMHRSHAPSHETLKMKTGRISRSSIRRTRPQDRRHINGNTRRERMEKILNFDCKCHTRRKGNSPRDTAVQPLTPSRAHVQHTIAFPSRGKRVAGHANHWTPRGKQTLQS